MFKDANAWDSAKAFIHPLFLPIFASSLLFSASIMLFKQAVCAFIKCTSRAQELQIDFQRIRKIHYLSWMTFVYLLLFRFEIPSSIHFDYLQPCLGKMMFLHWIELCEQVFCYIRNLVKLQKFSEYNTVQGMTRQKQASEQEKLLYCIAKSDFISIFRCEGGGGSDQKGKCSCSICDKSEFRILASVIRWRMSKIS